MYTKPTAKSKPVSMKNRTKDNLTGKSRTRRKEIPIINATGTYVLYPAKVSSKRTHRKTTISKKPATRYLAEVAAGKMLGPAIGIDLGTTYSCVSAFKNGKVEIIPNEKGNRITSSYVGFTESERLVGDAARNQVALNPGNTLYDSKRLIGKKFGDPCVTNDMKHWPFKVVQHDDRPMYEVKYRSRTRRFTPEEISAMILAKIKNIAEAHLGKSIKYAVISVPASFNDSQRQATKDAGVIAGIHVLRIINEPTAAAVAYGFNKEFKGERKVLIFDLGGGAFDVTVVTIDNGSLYSVKSTAGNSHLGGEDFDNRLVTYFIEEFKKKYRHDLSSNVKSLRRLRSAAERAKRNLSSSTKASVEIDSLYDGIDFLAHITRDKFEEINADLLDSTLEYVEIALKDAKCNKKAIDDVVLVGGSTRIPKIQSLLREYFGGKPIDLSINPDEAVAHGAAIQAAILSGDTNPKIQDVQLLDVAPLSLGIETSSHLMTRFIKRNTRIPCKKTERFTTCDEYQTVITIMVYEGERKRATDNNMLGNFILSNIPSAHRGKPMIDVIFDLDSNGILNVDAKVVSGGKSRHITIAAQTGRLSRLQIQKMITDSHKFKENEKIFNKNFLARKNLESYIYSVKTTVDQHGIRVIPRDRRTCNDACNKYITWLEEYLHVEAEKYNEKLKEFQKVCLPILTKLHARNTSCPTILEAE